jgi:hypothetical protein
MNSPHKSHMSRKKKIWLAVVAGLVVVGFSWWAWDQFVPRPLGDRLEYLGKRDYGNIFGFDSRPSSIYYYGTDMSPEELASYFDKAKYTPQGNFAFKHAQFTSPGNKTFTFVYEKDSSFVTDKKYTISLPGSQYKYAKGSL